MSKGQNKSKQKNNEMKILYHNEWSEQMKILKNDYENTVKKKGICLEWCWCCCECGAGTHIANKIAKCESLKNQINNLKCRCGCN